MRNFSLQRTKKHQPWGNCHLWYNGPCSPLALRFTSLEHHASFLGVETTIADMIVVIKCSFIILYNQTQLFTAYSASQLDILILVYKKREQTLRLTACWDPSLTPVFFRLKKLLYCHSHCFCCGQRHRKRELFYSF